MLLSLGFLSQFQVLLDLNLFALVRHILSSLVKDVGHSWAGIWLTTSRPESFKLALYSVFTGSAPMLYITHTYYCNELTRYCPELSEVSPFLPDVYYYITAIGHR